MGESKKRVVSTLSCAVTCYTTFFPLSTDADGNSATFSILISETTTMDQVRSSPLNSTSEAKS